MCRSEGGCSELVQKIFRSRAVYELFPLIGLAVASGRIPFD